jgi:hypothetical protein
MKGRVGWRAALRYVGNGRPEGRRTGTCNDHGLAPGVRMNPWGEQQFIDQP